MKFQAVKGTRDFYPEDMALRNALFDAWRRVSLRNGFVEYDGPILEPFDLLAAKSGEEIAEQLFTLTDRAGRRLAIRPEMTPTLARMINARAQALARPLKWFTMPRLCRGERPQRGRLREFFQWNIDVVGEGGAIADAEVIFVAVDLLRELGLGPADVVVKISSRPVVAALLALAEIPPDQHPRAYALLDKTQKMPADRMAAVWNEQFAAHLPYERLETLLAAESPEALRSHLPGADHGPAVDAFDAAARDLGEVFTLLRNLGITEYCEFDLRIVRGLAYYTGPVFEIVDRAGDLRALCGGGRYDGLLAALGGPAWPAVGFGMGDVSLALLLEQKNRTLAVGGGLDAFLIDADPGLFDQVLALAGHLRGRGVACAFSYRRAGVGKQLREANSRGAAAAVIFGQETRDRGVVTVKSLTAGTQHEVPLAALADELDILLRSPP